MDLEVLGFALLLIVIGILTIENRRLRKPPVPRVRDITADVPWGLREREKRDRVARRVK